MRKKLHIMHMLLSLETGGCENGIVNLINSMDENYYKVSVCCLEKVGELSERIHSNKRNIFLNKKNGRPTLNDILKLSNLFKTEKVDIVHTHGWGTLVLGYISAKVAGVPIIIHGEHGGLHIDNKRKIYLQKLLYRLVDCTVTVSKDLQTQLSSIFNVNEELFYPIINGVDITKFINKRDIEKPHVRHQLIKSSGGCLIGTVGRLVAWKRHDVLINAVDALVEQGYDVYLVIVGEGSERKTLQTLISKKRLEDRVFLVGRKDNVLDYLLAMDIFALTSSSLSGQSLQSSFNRPTEFEGVSNALLEAMACGIPVVASNVGGSREIIENAQTGFLYEPGNMTLLVDTLSKLIDDENLRISIGNSARRSIENKFSLQSMVKSYENLYFTIAHKKSLF